MLHQNVRSRQRKGGKLDPDYIGPYTVMNVDGKSIDLKDDKGHSCPKINKDHLGHFFWMSIIQKSPNSVIPFPLRYPQPSLTHLATPLLLPPSLLSVLLPSSLLFRLTVLQNSVYYFANMHAHVHLNIFFFSCNE